MMESQRGIDGSGGSGSDEFIQALYRGGELLTEGKVIEAKEYLERAITLRPENERCQNLLGLTYFGLTSPRGWAPARFSAPGASGRRW